MNDNNGAHNGKSNWHDSAGRFAKGNQGKPKGSSKNKLRDSIREFINQNWEGLPEWFAELKAKEKIDCLIALMPYAVSRLQSISLDAEETGFNNSMVARIDYSKLSETTLKEILANTNEE